MRSVSFALVLILLVPVLLAVGLFFLIRYLIRYNASQNQKKPPQQQELDRMKIDDL